MPFEKLELFYPEKKVTGSSRFLVSVINSTKLTEYKCVYQGNRGRIGVGGRKSNVGKFGKVRSLNNEKSLLCSWALDIKAAGPQEMLFGTLCPNPYLVSRLEKSSVKNCF